MTGFVRFITTTDGYSGLTKVDEPNLEEYLANCPARFVSYRLKRSLREKALYKISLNEIDPISDWVALRVVVEDDRTAEDLKIFFISSQKVGQSKIKFLDSKNYYEKPKGNDYKAYKIIVEVTAPGHKKPYVTEIQIVDRRRYFRYEISKSDPAHHWQQEKKKRLGREASGILIPEGEKILEKIFGLESRLIPLDEIVAGD